MRKYLLSIVFCAAATIMASASAPAGYYASLEGKSSNDLLEAVHDIVVNHTQLTYLNAWAYKSKIWTVNGKILDMYSGCSFAESNHCGSGEFDECDCYNREHAVPKSFWGCSSTSDESEPMISDLVHVIPTDYYANTQRSAWIYDEVKTASWTNSAGAKLGTSTSISQAKRHSNPLRPTKAISRVSISICSLATWTRTLL